MVNSNHENGVGRGVRRAMQIFAWAVFFGFLVADYGFGVLHHTVSFEIYVLLAFIGVFAHKTSDDVITVLVNRWILRKRK